MSGPVPFGLAEPAGPARPPFGLDGPAVDLLSEPATSSLATQALEDAAIWARSSVCIGFEADIPEPGDVLPFTVGHHGIHVERLPDGSLIGRFNKAQHGGCRVVPLQCRTGTKTRCSFTACGYSHDRRQIRGADPDSVSQLDQYLGLRPERLLPVAVETWGPLLLVRLDPIDATTCDWPPSATVIDPHAHAIEDSTIWRELAGNWKTVAMHLARSSRDGEAELLFPNAVVRRVDGLSLTAVLQPVALDRTLCRLRVFGDGRHQPAAAFFETMVRDAGLDPKIRPSLSVRDPRFERAFARAIETLAPVPPTPFFRTDEKQRW